MTDYRCTQCGEETPRELLTVKRVAFLEMGEGAKTLRARVVAWLCPICVATDKDWKLEAHHNQKPVIQQVINA